VKTTGIKSEAATAAWWRIQFESCQAALAEVLAENTENVEALADVVTDYGDRCDDLDGCDCSMARAARLTAHMRAPEGDHAAHTADEGGGGRG
jgi:hypothetical protein